MLTNLIQFKAKYSTTTKDKSKDDTRSAALIRAAYDEGTLLAPCVLLKCVGYDKDFYRALAVAKDAPNVHTPPSSVTATSKRVHEGDTGLDGIELQRRKSARTSI